MTKAKTANDEAKEKSDLEKTKIYTSCIKNCNSRNNTVKIRVKPKAGGYTVFFVYQGKHKKTGKAKLVYEYLDKEFHLTGNDKNLFNDKETFRLIEQKRADKEKELANLTTKDDTDFTKFYERIIDEKGDSWRLTYLQFIRFKKNKKVLFKDVDYKLCKDFANFLLKDCNSQNTASMRLVVFKSCIYEAVKMKLILPDVYIKGLSIDRITIEKECLSNDEVQKMIDAYCGNEETKNAFLMGIFTGLRYSDIIALTWDMLERNELSMTVRIKKTKVLQSVMLSENALELINKQKEAVRKTDKIFNPVNLSQMNKELKIWARNAGLTNWKKISFHVSRVTFITQSLRDGTPLQVVKKAVGHAKIDTTMIYVRTDEKELQDMAKKQTKFNLQSE